jgi:hypothetical protein
MTSRPGVPLSLSASAVPTIVALVPPHLTSTDGAIRADPHTASSAVAAMPMVGVSAGRSAVLDLATT